MFINYYFRKHIGLTIRCCVKKNAYCHQTFTIVFPFSEALADQSASYYTYYSLNLFKC